MNENAKQWSGAFLGFGAMVCVTLIAIMRPDVLGKETIAALLTAFGLRGTALVAHVFNKASNGDNKL